MSSALDSWVRDFLNSGASYREPYLLPAHLSPSNSPDSCDSDFGIVLPLRPRPSDSAPPLGEIHHGVLWEGEVETTQPDYLVSLLLAYIYRCLDYEVFRIAYGRWDANCEERFADLHAFVSLRVDFADSLDGFDSLSFSQLVDCIRATSLSRFEASSYFPPRSVFSPDHEALEPLPLSVVVYPPFDTIDTSSPLLFCRPNVPHSVSFGVASDGSELRILGLSTSHALQVFSHLSTMSSACVLGIPVPIPELPLLSTSETSSLLSLANTLTEEYDLNRSVIDVFREVVDSNPDGPAVEWGHSTETYSCLTYSELYRRVVSFSQFLLSVGVGRGDTVIHVVRRTPYASVAVMGIAHVGAVYFPMDINFPTKQKREMLGSARSGVFLTNDDLVSQYGWVQEDFGIRVIGISDDSIGRGMEEQQQQQQQQEERGERIQASDALYLYHTSGSTGFPKGVEGIHRNMIHMSRAYLDGVRRIGVDVTNVTQFANHCFVTFYFEIVVALLNGIRLIFIPTEVRYDGQGVLDYLSFHRAECFDAPPSLLHALPVDHPLPHLKFILFGGEPPNEATVQRWCRKVNLVNSFGMTDCSIASHAAILRPDDPVTLIGRPYKNVVCFILDRFRQLLPYGCFGSVWYSGPCTSRYVNEEIQRRAFAPSILGGDAMMMDSRDIMRWRPSRENPEDVLASEMLFLRRRKNPVFVGGKRVDLTSLASLLQTHEAVHQAVVVDRAIDASVDETRVLVAFVVLQDAFRDRSKHAVLRESISSFLVPTIPSYLHPKVIVFRREIPLNFGGKIWIQKLRSLQIRVEDPSRSDDGGKTQVQSTRHEVDLLLRKVLGGFIKERRHMLTRIQMKALAVARKSFVKGVDVSCFHEEDTVQAFLEYLEVTLSG